MLKMDIHAILKYILVLVLGLSTTREDWGHSVVLGLVEPFKGLGHFVFHDNFFSKCYLCLCSFTTLQHILMCYSKTKPA